ncbi:MAG: adenylate/guanylate cyclase domain-containing protein [Proteobacteria bacterium]|nr:adenylate/guanylate cyclase domain-containing protein [Pseudomonadota bacterium]
MTELSILFADIAESTSLFEQHGDEVARSTIGSVLDMLVQVAGRHQGTLIKTIGDEIMCTFPNANCALSASVAMQEGVSGNFVLGNHPIMIRVGFHHGKVIEEDNDVFGDAVNVAARMTGFAKKDQIITNSATYKYCKLPAHLNHRSLGKTKIKGKLLQVEIVEILWQQDIGQITRVSSALDIKVPTVKKSLALELNGHSQVMTNQSPTKTIGRGDDCDIQTDVLMASRLHGDIQFIAGNFRYTDQSTNGTWIKMSSDPIKLHRDTVVLQTDGMIAFGESTFDDSEHVLFFKLTSKT